jgi:hypothetical protein
MSGRADGDFLRTGRQEQTTARIAARGSKMNRRIPLEESPGRKAIPCSFNPLPHS